MKIKISGKYIAGEVDTDKIELVCIHYKKYNSVELAFRESDNCSNIVFTEIDPMIPYDDACKFGDEIVRRWNEFNNNKKDKVK